MDIGYYPDIELTPYFKDFRRRVGKTTVNIGLSICQSTCLRRTGRRYEPTCTRNLKFVDAFRICLKSDKNRSLYRLPVYSKEDILPSSVFEIERGGVLCAVRGEAKERVNDLNITIQHDPL